MRAALANDLSVVVHSTLEPVAQLMAAIPQRSVVTNPKAIAAEILVTADSAAPDKRFLLHEYYTRIEWLSGTHARVETNGAVGSIDWSGRTGEVLQGKLGIFPEAAPESLGMFLRLVMSMLLPSRRAALVHASGVVSQSEAVIFLGDSGAGKTTTARRVGREGALRFADDMAILRVSEQGTASVEACAFDRGGRLPGREHRSWPLRAAYDVRKGASVTQDMGRVKDPLATWCAAILSSTGPPGSLEKLLGLASDLCKILPPRALNVSASGPVRSAIAPPQRPERILLAPHSTDERWQ
ncbi:MAG TPA: hypothetical protein VJV79_11580 [Polyangiaceae bacterium]|nr:hypothetical protein [Polyangiaceae bacterium]